MCQETSSSWENSNLGRPVYQSKVGSFCGFFRGQSTRQFEYLYMSDIVTCTRFVALLKIVLHPQSHAPVLFYATKVSFKIA